MFHTTIFILLTNYFLQLCRSDIGDISVKESKFLIISKVQRIQCDSLLPDVVKCDKANEIVDDYCDKEALKIENRCGSSVDHLIRDCNSAEASIRNKCLKDHGYITKKCGNQFEKLNEVCKVCSTTSARDCMKNYQQIENECFNQYLKVDQKCKRIYYRYNDFCESGLKINNWNGSYARGEFKVDENKIKLETIKKIALSNDLFEEENTKTYERSSDVIESLENEIKFGLIQNAELQTKDDKKLSPIYKQIFNVKRHFRFDKRFEEPKIEKSLNNIKTPIPHEKNTDLSENEPSGDIAK